MSTMDMDYNLKSLANFKLFPCVFKKAIFIAVVGFLSTVRLYLPLDVQRQCFSWVKLPTTDFRTVKTKNLRNLRDRAPLTLTFNYIER